MVTRALVSGNRDIGVFTVDPGTSVTLSDVVIENTQARESDGAGGWGLFVRSGATAVLARARIAENREVGVSGSGEGTSLTLLDLVIADTQPEANGGQRGWGLYLEEGATADVTRALVSGNRHAGVFAVDTGTSLTLSDVVVENTRARESDGTGGRGLNVQLDAMVMVTRARIVRNAELGVFVSDVGTSLTLSDVVVEDTQAQDSDGTGGGGLHVQIGGTAEVSRTRIVRNRGSGVLASEVGASVRLSDVVVAQTDAQACGPTTCSESPFGLGLAGVAGASVVATRFEVLDSALCGVMVADDGEVDLSLGQVSGSPIGVCLQVDGYPLSRLTESVRYLDNGSNLEATSLPVPESRIAR